MNRFATLDRPDWQDSQESKSVLNFISIMALFIRLYLHLQNLDLVRFSGLISYNVVCYMLYPYSFKINDTIAQVIMKVHIHISQYRT